MIHVAGAIELNQDFLGEGVYWGKTYCLQTKSKSNRAIPTAYFIHCCL